MHSVSLDLVERVLPVAPYRHWVLALPAELRFLLARDEDLLAKVRKIFAGAVQSWLRAKARSLGVLHVSPPDSGTPRITGITGTRGPPRWF